MSILGIGIDLTQHLPLVAIASYPAALANQGQLDRNLLLKHWPPEVKLAGTFRTQPPCCLLPLLTGEPFIVGEAAAKHRRGAGLYWPAEAQIPYGNEPSGGVGRIPVAAAWAAILPQTGTNETMSNKGYSNFSWSPDGHDFSAGAGQLLAQSIRSYVLRCIPDCKSLLVTIVVPDALGESGQQLLVDNLSQVGFDPQMIHLLPRPAAVAIRWCQTHALPASTNIAVEEEGENYGHVRVLTMPMDGWEATSLELRIRRFEKRNWLVPVRHRSANFEGLPELPWWGTMVAWALARSEFCESSEWWQKLFASEWLHSRLKEDRQINEREQKLILSIRQTQSSAEIQAVIDKLPSLQPLWNRLIQRGQPLRELLSEKWRLQEQAFSVKNTRCRGLLIDGSLAQLKWVEGKCLGLAFLPGEMQGLAGGAAVGKTDAVFGAALASAAIHNNLPCYRETLLPLDLYVLGKDQNDDPAGIWQPLVEARTVEAGKEWISPKEIRGLQIQEGQDHLALPLRRVSPVTTSYRKVGTELAQPATKDEPVTLRVTVKPGQGFAQVRIESITPQVFSTRLNWKSMTECSEPERPKLAYLPGVSRIQPVTWMFERAEESFRSTFEVLEHLTPHRSAYAVEQLKTLTTFLNKWPLAYREERQRGNHVEKDFLLHYGVIGSAGKLEATPAPGLAKSLRNIIGQRFAELATRNRENSPLGKALLRAAGWFYTAIPSECHFYLTKRLSDNSGQGLSLSAVELHAIGLSIEAHNDVRRFYTVLAVRLQMETTRLNNWLRALRNIWRFRNHALSGAVIDEATLLRIAERLCHVMEQEVARQSFGSIFKNCLEALPFLLKRRRYQPEFLDPGTPLARRFITLIDEVESSFMGNLPSRLRTVPRSTINFIKRQATETDLDNLLGLTDDDNEDDND